MSSWIVRVWVVVAGLLLLAACSKDHLDAGDALGLKSSGVCIYPLNTQLVKYPKDTFFSTGEMLSDTPYIQYNDIVSYDTVFHILTLRYSSADLAKRIHTDNFRFALTLDGRILFRGSFGKPGINIPSDEPVILTGFKSDTLQRNQIRINSRYPVLNYDYTDERYQPELFQRLKMDKKATGRLFVSTAGESTSNINAGVAFYLVTGIENVPVYNQQEILGITDYSKLKLEEDPFVAYDDVVFYDSIQHLFCIRKPVDFSANTFSQWMNKVFVIAVDKRPVLMGTFYSAIYSAPCGYNYVMIDEPYENPLYRYLLRIYPANFKSFSINSVQLNPPLMISRLVSDKKIWNNFVF